MIKWFDVFALLLASFMIRSLASWDFSVTWKIGKNNTKIVDLFEEYNELMFVTFLAYYLARD